MFDWLASMPDMYKTILMTHRPKFSNFFIQIALRLGKKLIDANACDPTKKKQTKKIKPK